MKMHSEYRLPVFITVDEMVKAGDDTAILAVNIFGDLEGRKDRPVLRAKRKSTSSRK